MLGRRLGCPVLSAAEVEATVPNGVDGRELIARNTIVVRALDGWDTLGSMAKDDSCEIDDLSRAMRPRQRLRTTLPVVLASHIASMADYPPEKSVVAQALKCNSQPDLRETSRNPTQQQQPIPAKPSQPRSRLAETARWMQHSRPRSSELRADSASLPRRLLRLAKGAR